MRSHRIVFILLFLISATATVRAAASKAVDFNDVIRKTEPLSPEEERAGFHLPPGFEAQLVASEPDINKPINMSFDGAGRLWITSTVEYPHPAKDPEKARDSIKILSDFDANGKARKIVTFADKLNIPIGVIPYGKGAIGHSIPFINYFEDTTGAGKADKRTVLLDRIGFQKDTHGMSGNFVRGFDGWIYATHGFSNDSTVKALDGSEIKMNSGNSYRFRPDGSHIEQYTWGQVNPFGLTLDPLGNVYSADCHTLPIYQLLRGAWYPSFGKKDDGLGFGPAMMSHLHGSTAIGGIVIYSDDRFPEEFHNNGFVGNVMTCKINRDQLVDTGTTRTAKEMPDFLSADDPWFRPVCMQMGPDGAIYVADFYNRIIGHYEVSLAHPGRDRERGRIWRIVYKGTPEKPLADKLPPDLTAKNADELIALTGETNLTLRMLALFQLTDRIGKAGVEPLKAILKSGTPNQKVCALWALNNLKLLDEADLSALTVDPDPSVRTHSMKVLSELETWSDSQRASAVKGLGDANTWVQRAAADALGRHPSVDNVKPLIALRLAADPKDTHLVHTIKMALRNQLLTKGTFEKIVALNLDEKEMHAVVDSAVGAASEDAAALLVKWLSTSKEAPAEAAKHFEHALKYLPVSELDGLVASARARFGSDTTQQLVLLKSINEGAARRGIPISPSVRTWAIEAVDHTLESGEKGSAPALLSAIELVGRMKLTEVETKLNAVALNKKINEKARAAAIASLATVNSGKLGATFTAILRDTTEPGLIRESAAAALGSSDYPEKDAILLEAMNGEPDKRQTKIALALCASQSGAEKLLQAVAAGKASARLLLNRSVGDRLNTLNIANLDDRIATLTKGLPPANDQIQITINERVKAFKADKASADLGAKVFEKNCMVCHQLDGKGKVIGPQLDGVGARGLDRIAEDVLDPSRNVDAAFRMSVLKLASGEVYSGLKRREEGEQIVFADSKGEEKSFNKKDISKIRETQNSLMPDGFAEAISPEDFNHLMAFLLSKTVKR